MRIAAMLMGLPLAICAATQAETVAIQVQSAVVEHDEMGQDLINVILTQEGQRSLAAFTQDRVGRTIHLRIGGVLLTSPTVMSPIDGGSLQLSPGATGFGGVSVEEIVKRLSTSGAMEFSDDK